MPIGFKQINGYLWPECDTDCAAVIFDRVADMERAIQHCNYFRVVVQAGGNTGVWPKRLGQRFEAVYTFEPEPDNFYCLVNNCPEENIITIQAALGNEHGRVGMGYPEGRRNMGACNVKGTGLIPTLRIDDFRFAYCDLIQMDIEGYESHAIAGAQDTIHRCRPVLMIEDKGLSDHYGIPKGWTKTFADEHGYTITETIARDVIMVPR